MKGNDRETCKPHWPITERKHNFVKKDGKINNIKGQQRQGHTCFIYV